MTPLVGGPHRPRNRPWPLCESRWRLVRWLCRERAASVVPAEPATHDTQFVGKAKTMPSTLYMDGTSPVTVFIRATTDELRQLHNQTVTLAAVAAVDGEAPAVGGEEREGVFGKPYDMDDPA